MSCFLRRLCEQMFTYCISEFSDCIAIVLTWELELNFCSFLHVCNVTTNADRFQFPWWHMQSLLVSLQVG
jgi:hypothetical protein